MFDHDNGFSLGTQFLNDGNDARYLGQAEAGEKFIQNNQVRSQGNAFCKFQPFEIPLWQGACSFVGYMGIPLKTHFFQQIQRNGVPCPILASRQFLYSG